MHDGNLSAGGAPGAAAVAPATSEPAWHEGIITKDAAGAESLADPASWLDKAPKPLSDFVRSQMTAARAKTEGMFKLPGADAKPEEWDPVYKALGRPDAPDGYGIKAPEKLPDGVNWDDVAAGEFAGVAHKIGLTPSQVAALQEFQLGHIGKSAAAVKAQAQADIAKEQETLKTTFGVNLPNVAADAQKAAIEAGLKPDVLDPASGEFWGVDSLKLVSGLVAKIKKLSGEDSGSSAGANPTQGGYAYAQAVSTDPKHPDYEAYRKNDPAIVQRVNDGWKQMPKTGG